jgi:hypothetical protein
MGQDYHLATYIGFYYPPDNKDACRVITAYAKNNDLHYIIVIDKNIKCVLFAKSEIQEEFGRLYYFIDEDEYGEEVYPWTGIEEISKDEYNNDAMDNCKAKLLDPFLELIIGLDEKEEMGEVNLKFGYFRHGRIS